MKEITSLEMHLALTILKSPEVEYNANSIARELKITPMGALKILKKLEKESLVVSRKVGKASIYKIKKGNTYASRYFSLFLSREALHTPPRVKRWVQELKKIKNADLVIIFGSVLETEKYHDVDVLFVTEKKNFSRLQREIESLNALTLTKIHPLFQTFADLVENIKRRDKPILQALKGVVVAGEEKMIEVYHESRQE